MTINSGTNQYLRRCSIQIINLDKQINGLPRGSVVKNLLANAGTTGGMGWIPGPGRSPGEGNGNALQYGQISLAGLQSMGLTKNRT